MKITVGPIRVWLEPLGDRICTSIETGKPFEEFTLAVWAMLCAKGGTVIDVGGYTGLFSIAAGRLGCDVVCFEPLPLNAERINKNAKTNSQRGKIRLIEAAASDRIGESFINVNPHVPGLTSGASLSNEKLGRRVEKMAVALMTIDMLELKQVTAIKIDAERHEPAVLRGAWDTIYRCKPSLIVEVLSDDLGLQVLDELRGSYKRADILDERNWLLVPNA